MTMQPVRISPSGKTIYLPRVTATYDDRRGWVIMVQNGKQARGQRVTAPSMIEMLEEMAAKAMEEQ